MTALPLARRPYARLQDANINDAVYREFAKVEQQQIGMFVPKTLGAARSPYTVQGTDWLILCDCTAGAITLTFPAAGRLDGFFVQVIKTDVSANAVTLSGTFNGVANPTLTKQYQARTINAGNGVYYFTPSVFPEDIPSGTFPGNYVIAGTLEVDGNFSVGNPNTFSVTASSGRVVAGTPATGFTPNTGSIATFYERVIEQVAPTNVGYRSYGFAGSLASPTATPSGRFVWFAAGQGYDGSAFTGAGGRASFIATETWGSTARGTKFVVSTTANGSTSLTDRFIIDHDGTLLQAGDVNVNTGKFTVTASSGNTAIAGTANVTGLVTASAGVAVTGGASGAGKVWYDATDGLILQAKNGSAHDVSIYTQGAGYIMTVPTGTAKTLWGGDIACTSDGGVNLGASGARFASLLLTSAVQIGGNQIIAARSTGWTAQTAAASKADLGATPTVAALASWASAVQAALTTHGLLGA